MGMYTELVLNVILKKELPEIVIEILKALESRCFDNIKVPEHEFFKCDLWEFIGYSHSYSFVPHGYFKYEQSDRIGVSYISTKCDLKNHDHEIQKFLDWVSPYCDESNDCGMLGYVQYEDDGINGVYPKLIYFEDGKLTTRSMTQ